MRYFGKDGPQCQPPELSAESTGQFCRQLGRAVLFGRVPRACCLWLGLGLLMAMLGLGLWSVTSLQQDSGRTACRDALSAVAIRR